MNTPPSNTPPSNTPPSNIELWRRWVLLMILHEQNGGLTGTIAARARRWGWRLFPDHRDLEIQAANDRICMYRALTVCEKYRQVMRVPKGTTSYWTITPVGRELAVQHLFKNPNITKAALEAAWT